MATTKKSRSGTSTEETGFTAEERAAMQERARELRTAKRGGAKADLEPEVLAKIAEMSEPDRGLAQRVHELVREAAPQLKPRTWYGMPAYAKDGKVLCFFQAAGKFDARYASFGFNDVAALDDGPMWPTAFALVELTPEVEARITELVTRAAG